MENGIIFRFPFFLLMKVVVKKLSLKELCDELNISLATGKNWIKLGKILPKISADGKMFFDKTYVNNLIQDIQTGKNNSLRSRRNKKYVSGNKLYKSYVQDCSKNLKIVQSIIDYIGENKIKLTENKISEIVSCCAFSLIKNKENIIKDYLFLIEDISKKYNNSEFNNFEFTYTKNEDTLGLLYISLKSLNERKSKGTYYTPSKIVQKLCNNLEIKKGETVYDCCCGTGNFLLNLNTDFDYIYGNDIDELSVKITKINMALKYKITDKNILNSHITCHDFLEYNDTKKYDFIIGNPPWRTGCEHKEYQELYDAVTDKSLTLLKNKGVLSFVLPEAILNVKTHKEIRRVISETNSIKYIEYLGNVFDGVNCPSIILKILHDNKPFTTKGMVIKTKNRQFTINQEQEFTSEYFNFLTNDDEYKILKKIENIDNKITLKNNSQFALGIVTGDNKKYISPIKNNKNEMVLKGVNITKFNYNNSNIYITFTPENFQQVAPVELYRAKEKLFYKFISKELVFAYDNNQTLSLNSCNILIPQIRGLDIKYILAILNSKVAQFYFKAKFNSLKVLREHIENIPIPKVSIEKQRIIISYVDKILKRGYSAIIYNQIEKQVANLFGLTGEEYSLICSYQ